MTKEAPPTTRAVLARADRPVMHGSYVVLMLAGAKARGLSLEPILASCAIPEAVLNEPGVWVSQTQFARLMTVLTEAMDDEIWGLGRAPIRPGTFATACRIAALGPTLGDSLELTARFYRCVSDDVALRIHQADGEARVAVEIPVGEDDRAFMLHSTEVFFAYGLACWLVGRRIPLRRLDNGHEERLGMAYAGRVFRATSMSFRRGRTVLTFDKSWLQRPVLTDPRRLADLLHTLPGSLLLGYRDNTAFGERLRALLRQRLSDPPPMTEAAFLLGVSEQTLRRYLAKELLTYQDVKTQVRLQAAADLLSFTSLSVGAIAHTIGFSELSSFHRAFKRWTGMSPGRYRLQHAHTASKIDS
ncbi:AraC family transcriptional regulator ligand-binding domain-containing protein [Mycobacterium marseillense]|uniref:AraC family transcriptional regulator n=1 Tax=Mycobacterium marseillense TaxID=701042 RepID=UPI0025927FEE|nr:AraC family transcriptional regulator [Mycobacterium marseillense]MDM3975295.1 AraC family transcriptional regulator ligand-binding domain-containing protein [Mycobacterium marseillense]